MNTDTTKVMEQALQAAVARMNHGPSGSDTQTSGSSDPIGLLMTVLSKLLQDNEGNDELIEKIEGLQKDDLAFLRVQVKALRKQLHQLLEVQEALVSELREVQKQQSAVGNAVLDLAEQMARVELIDPGFEDSEPDRGDSDSDSALGRRKRPSGPIRMRQKPAKK